MKYDWFLFDLDGTLTESGEGITKSVKNALEIMGKEVPPQSELDKFVGPPLKWSFSTIAHLTEEESMKAIDLFRERYGVVGWKENRVYPGIAQLLRSIKKRGGHMALASAKLETVANSVLNYFGLMPFFERVCAVPAGNYSPDKVEIIDRALPRDVDKSRAVMIGDRVYDVKGALDFGIRAVGANYGYGTRDEFAGCDFIADSPRDLEMYFTGNIERGKFITFEGIDGCGKSTQFSMAVEKFSRLGWDVLSTREPGGCDISEALRGIVLSNKYPEMTRECEALIYAAARSQHVAQTLNPAINSGKLTFCDRYLDSSIAYQGCGRELSEPLIRQINAIAVGDLTPDLTLLYRTDISTAHDRVLTGGEPDRIEKENIDFNRRVDGGYVSLMNKSRGRIVEIDGNRTIDEVFSDTCRVIGETLN